MPEVTVRDARRDDAAGDRARSGRPPCPSWCAPRPGPPPTCARTTPTRPAPLGRAWSTTRSPAPPPRAAARRATRSSSPSRCTPTAAAAGSAPRCCRRPSRPSPTPRPRGGQQRRPDRDGVRGPQRFPARGRAPRSRAVDPRTVAAAGPVPGGHARRSPWTALPDLRLLLETHNLAAADDPSGLTRRYTRRPAPRRLVGRPRQRARAVLGAAGRRAGRPGAGGVHQRPGRPPARPAWSA